MFWIHLHSMARANLNKSVRQVTNTTTASKYIPKRTRICIDWNPPFQTQIYLVKVPLNVNIVKQDLLHEKQFLKILWSEAWGEFQKRQILVLLGMYFDAAVVEVEKNSLLFRLALAMLCIRCAVKKRPDNTTGSSNWIPDFQKVPFVHHFSEKFESKPVHIQAWRKCFKWWGQIYMAGVN